MVGLHVVNVFIGGRWLRRLNGLPPPHRLDDAGTVALFIALSFGFVILASYKRREKRSGH